jgi:DNA-binding MarR family transcriptional regulator
LAERGSITNSDVRELLHVSQSAATRYLDILEREGKIRQVGAGKASRYELVR